MLRPILSLLLCDFIVRVAGYEYIDCFAGLPSSFSKDDTYQYQTKDYCYGRCVASNNKYFALFNGGDCYCGDDNPSGSESTSGSCNTPCNGYGPDMCGGESSYSVYSIDDTDSDSNSQGSSSTITLSQSRTSSDSPESTDTSQTSPVSSSSSTPTTTSSSSSSSPSSSSSTSSSSSAAVVTTITSATNSEGNIVTQIQTVAGSTLYVTKSVTQSTASSTASTESDSKGTDRNNSSSKKPVGAIVGGVVGGVVGLAALAVLILLLMRRVNKKREQERMEKEYQEAIKPVDFDDTLYTSSHSSHKNNTNPFDDNRRISNGSVVDNTTVTTPGTNNVLTVVNPDE